MKKFPRLIVVLASLNIALALGFVYQKWDVSRQEAEKARQKTLVTANSFDKLRYVKKEDYLRVTQMQRRWHATGTMTDEELRYCLSLLKSDPNPGERNSRVIQQMVVFYPMQMYVTHFSERQKDIIYEYATKILAGDGGQNGNDHQIALTLVSRTGDKRIIPAVLPLLASRREGIKASAQETLNDIRKTL